jgi:hypothetical protein
MFFEIATSRGPILVDEADRDLVSKFNWYGVAANKGGKLFYAHARVPKIGKRILMHRFLMQPPPNLVVHHRNGNGLDNRRENLEVTTQRRNTKYIFEGRSTGVYFDKKSGHWRVAIRASFGLYANEERARSIAASIQDKLESHLLEIEPGCSGHPVLSQGEVA